MQIPTFLAAGLLSGGEFVILGPVDDVDVGEEPAGGGMGVAPVAASGQIKTPVGAFQGSGVSGGGEIFVAKGSKGGFLLHQVSTGFYKRNSYRNQVSTEAYQLK